MEKLTKFEIFARLALSMYDKHNIKVALTRSRANYYNPMNKTIVIEERLVKRKQEEACIVFLHELGHAIIDEEDFEETVEEDWRLFYEEDTITENIRVEEYIAWCFANTMMEEFESFLTTKKCFMKRLRKKFNTQMKESLKCYEVDKINFDTR